MWVLRGHAVAEVGFVLARAEAQRRRAAEHAAHAALESAGSNDTLHGGTDGGQAGGDNAGGHFDGGPADCWGEGVARVGATVGEENARSIC